MFLHVDVHVYAFSVVAKVLAMEGTAGGALCEEFWWTHCRAQTSSSAKMVVPWGKHNYEIPKEEGQRRESEKKQMAHL